VKRKIFEKQNNLTYEEIKRYHDFLHNRYEYKLRELNGMDLFFIFSYYVVYGLLIMFYYDTGLGYLFLFLGFIIVALFSIERKEKEWVEK
jgi:uncharacterized ion transporter superfamily protein YfcC